MIYFLQDSKSNAIKIGYAASPEQRAATLQTGNAAELVLLASCEGDRTHESKLHREFAAHRIAGEWFHPAPPLLRMLLSCEREESYRDGAAHQQVASSWVDPRPPRQRQGGVRSELTLWVINAETSANLSRVFCVITNGPDYPPDEAAALAFFDGDASTLLRCNDISRINNFNPSQLHDWAHDQRRDCPTTPKTQTASPYRVGMRVIHPDYGCGIISESADGRVRIRFPAAGEKRFVADVVKLEIVSA